MSNSSPTASLTVGLERNARLYPWFQGSMAFEGWIPIFFLYFSSHLPLTQVIQLSVVYYATVFILEVPSGYCSDRFGRRTTLLVAALCRIVACAWFLGAGDFTAFAVAQIFMGAGSAFRSGGNTALHYDSLDGVGKAHDFARREALAQRFSLTSLGLAALAGGVSGYLDLRVPYALTLLASTASLAIALRFTEPVQRRDRAASFTDNVTVCIRRLADPVLGGLFTLVVLMYALEHVPFEFYQAYISVLERADLSWLSSANSPLLSGAVIAISMFGGVIGASMSVRLADRIGLWGSLSCATSIQLLIILGLATWLHPVCLALVFARNLAGALVHAPINAAIAPRVAQQQRATYLSLQAMASKVGFGALLYAMSLQTGGAELDWPTLQSVLRIALFVGVGAVAVLLAIRVPLTRTPRLSGAQR